MVEGYSQCHSVDNELHCQIAAVSWNTSVVESWDAGIGDSVLIDQVPHDLVEDGGPGRADGVDCALAVDTSVGQWVGGQAGAVEVASDTSGVVGDPVTHWLVGGARLGRLEHDGNSHKIRPSLTHATGLKDVQAGGVGWATG